jgi:hypothetical protein
MLDGLSFVKVIVFITICIYFERLVILINNAWNYFINGEALVFLKSVEKDAVFELVLDVLVLQKFILSRVLEALAVSMCIDKVLNRDVHLFIDC